MPNPIADRNPGVGAVALTAVPRTAHALGACTDHNRPAARGRERAA